MAYAVPKTRSWALTWHFVLDMRLFGTRLSDHPACLRSILAVISTAWLGWRCGGSWCRPLVRLHVVVPGVCGQHLWQVPLAEDPHMAGALAAKRACEPLRVRVCPCDRTGVLITRV